MEDKPPKNPKLFAKSAFNKASQKLNPFNLNDLWSINGLFSSIEYFDSFIRGFNSFFPLLNFEKVAMLSKAILASKSKNYKIEKFNINLIPYIFNNLSDAAYTPELTEEGLDFNKRLLNFMAKKVTYQYNLQKLDLPKALSRTYVLYEYIPNRYKNELEKKHKTNYVNIPEVFYNNYGLTVKEYLIIGFIIFAYNNHIYKKFFKINEKLFDEIVEKRKKGLSSNFNTKILIQIINDTSSTRNSLFFNPNNLQVKNIIDISKINNFLILQARTSKELSELQTKFPFNKGDIAYQLSPLQRYPIVKTDDQKYIVPNMRFYHTFTSNIHFILQDLFPENSFNETFGSVFEFYIKDFLNDRLDNKIIIPETRYLKSKNNIDGPDVSIIDKKENSIILIEVKSKNLKLDSKISPISDELIHDLNRSFDALEKLPQKYEDLIWGFKEYSYWQKDINSIVRKDSDNVYTFVVINHGVYYLPEIINLYRMSDKEHFLNKFPFKYGIITIENFETLVELACSRKEKLTNLLKSYWFASKDLSPKAHSAEQFEGLSVDKDNLYLNKFSDILFSDLKSK